MEVVTIYRVEKMYAYYGPYYFLDTQRVMDKFPNVDWENHPPPSDDPTLHRFLLTVSEKEQYKYHFAFISMEDLHNWFSPADALEYLLYLGFEVISYDIHRDNIVLGRDQLIFHKQKACNRRVIWNPMEGIPLKDEHFPSSWK